MISSSSDANSAVAALVSAASWGQSSDISDFDPAGQLTVARKIEHLIYRCGLDLDIQVRVVALTREQVIECDIPPIPLKETEKRAANFHEQHGGLAARA